MPALRQHFRTPSIEDLSLPAVSSLIIFLAYSSQYLFYYIEPGPLSTKQAIWFNIFVFAIWPCYYQACFVDPGAKGWVARSTQTKGDDEDEEVRLKKGVRWCKKCEAVKPPRAHHCKKCGRCIPKMDHHCPWTTNCVSHTTFPHFLRFIIFAVFSMAILAYHLFIRLRVIWDNRNLPSYLGPPVWALAHLFVLSAVNGLTLFALLILLSRAIYGLLTNITMIESWEIERHEALVNRSKRLGGFVYANGGQKMRIQHQEFPYDIGIWKNICQGMGTSNVFMWMFPFGGGPGIQSASHFEVNGFEDASKVWPPPDPDKMPRAVRPQDYSEIRDFGTAEEEKAAFRRRQQTDYKRWAQRDYPEEGQMSEEDSEEYESEYEEGIDGEEGWTNSDGDRLRDYGVDEDAEVLVDDDDVPLAELLRRRKLQ